MSEPVSRLFDHRLSPWFWSRVHPEPNSGCWFWLGESNQYGYGRINMGDVGKRAMKLTHRVAYEALVGPIPVGLEIDHLCRNTFCCNPRHLEPVTHQENVARGEAGAVTAARCAVRCKRGHEFTPENCVWRADRVGKSCRTCERDGLRERRKARRST